MILFNKISHKSFIPDFNVKWVVILHKYFCFEGYVVIINTGGFWFAHYYTTFCESWTVSSLFLYCLLFSSYSRLSNNLTFLKFSISCLGMYRRHKKLQKHAFGDDVALWYENLVKWTIKLNLDKTRVMAIEERCQANIQTEGMQLEQILGSANSVKRKITCAAKWNNWIYS